MQRLDAASLLGLAGWLLVSFSAAALGAIATSSAGSFYEQLTRPVWAPTIPPSHGKEDG